MAAPRVVCFAGRLAYTQYGPIKRLILRLIAQREGGSTDTRRDHELTDWTDVARFAETWHRRLERPKVAPSLCCGCQCRSSRGRRLTRRRADVRRERIIVQGGSCYCSVRDA
jgi:hypothetical protein